MEITEIASYTAIVAGAYFVFYKATADFVKTRAINGIRLQLTGFLEKQKKQLILGKKKLEDHTEIDAGLKKLAKEYYELPERTAPHMRSAFVNLENLIRSYREDKLSDEKESRSKREFTKTTWSETKKELEDYMENSWTLPFSTYQSKQLQKQILEIAKVI